MSEEPTNFLYPFIDAQEDDPQSLLADLAASAQAKAAESLALRRTTLEANADLLDQAATEMARRFAAGGRMFTFGNGGSCTDSTTLAALFSRPPAGKPLPAWSLTADQAIVTALGNDVGFELVFARQLIARAKAGDIAIAMSTSGNSPNLLDRAGRGAPAWFVHRRFRRLRRRRLREQSKRGRLLHRSLAKRAPNSGIPSAAGLSAVVGHPATVRRSRFGGRMSKSAGEYLSSGPQFAEGEVIERIEVFRRRRPRLLDDHVNLAHGAGGKASAALIDAVFMEAFRNPLLESLGDGAVLTLPGGERLAMSTDSFVVQPRRFPGGSIGELAVHGTCNDLAMSGAVPSWISAAFVLEEGFPIAELKEIVADMAAAAAKAGVQIVTGDTKVVPKGAADGMFVTTTGVGVIPSGRTLSPASVRAGDKVLLSGSMGDHGMAVMLARGDLAIEADIHSDTASVSPLVELLMAAAPSTRWLRDATRGGVGTVCNELAQACGLGVLLEEERLPVRPMVNGACELLGIDPALRRQRGQVRRRRRTRRGRRRAGRAALASAGRRRGRGRGNRHRTGGKRGAAYRVRRHPDRRHARRRPAAADLLKRRRPRYVSWNSGSDR